MSGSGLRPLERADFPAVVECAAHYPGFGSATGVFLQRIERGWGAGASSFGSIVETAGRVVGFATAIFLERRLGGETVPFCCLGPWYVLPDHRARSLALMASVLTDRTCTYVTMSPNESSVRVLGRFGFAFLDTEYLVFPPLLQAATLVRRPERLTSATADVVALAEATDRTFIEDHTIYGCNAVLVGRDDDYGLVITKRRSLRGRPVSEIVYARNAERIVRSFERVKLKILGLERSIAVMADARILGPRPPRGLRRGRHRMYRSPRFGPAQIDNLYSEIVVR